MLSAIYHRLRLILRKLWVRVVAISLLGVVAVLAAKLIGPFLPPSLGHLVGANSVDQLLDILSSSMLAVTTFSLSVMVSVHRSVSSQWTPRAHRIQLRDRSTQMVLATFIGAFVYALSSIILRSADVFEDRDIVVLFAMTLLVIVLVVVMIMRWLFRLQTMGSLADTANRIADLTRTAYRERMDDPCLGAQALTSDLVLPEGVVDVTAPRSGYVERVFASELAEKARGCDGLIYVLKGVGDYVNTGEVLAQVSDERLTGAALSGIQIGTMRDIEQDPGFGLYMLAEIASKALSPGVNDSGTAIDMVDRMTGILESRMAPRAAPSEAQRFASVFLPPLDPVGLLLGPFALVSRDGAAVLEVQLVLQDRFAALARHPDPDIAAAAARLRQEALERAMEAIPYEIDRTALAEHAGRLTQTSQPMSGTIM